MFRLHHSTGVTGAIVLLVFGLLSVSEARPGEPQAKPAASAARSERSIHRALTEGAPAQAKRLLDQGANIEARNAQGATPLITASGRGNLTLVTLLLNQHARVETTDRAGNTALHEASFYGQVHCVEALLAAGAQTSTRNALAFTPLHQAVRRFWEISGESRADRLARQAKVIDVLLRHGADPDLRDTSGRTPIILAVESNNGSLRQAFNRPPAQAIPAAETPTTTHSPEATAEGSQGVPATPSLGLAGSSDVPVDHPMLSQSVDRLQTIPSFTPPPDIPAKEGIQPEVTLIPIPPTAPTESSPGPTSAESLPPARERPSTTPELPEATSPQLTLPIPAPIVSHPTMTPSPVTTTPPQLSEMPPWSAAEPPSPHQPVNPEVAPSTAPTPLIAAIDITPEARPVTPPSPDQPRRSLAPMSEAAEETRKPRQPAQFTPSGELTPPQSSPPMASTDSSAPASSTPQAGATGPSTDRPPVPLLTPVPDRKEDPPAEDDRRPWMFQNLGFGLGLGWTHNLGPRRVDSVTVVNRIVRIDNERNDLVRFMPEIHLWIDRWDEQRWSWGPFLTVAPGSRVIDAVGFGLMMGYRPHRNDHYSFNVGIGGTLDLDARVLGDGLIANEPLPPRETTARTKQTTAAGLLVLFSVGWDLSAPHHPAQTDRK